MSCITSLEKIVVYRANDRTFNISITENGSTTDITGWTIFFTVKTRDDISSNDSNAIIVKTATIINPTVAPQAQIVLTNSDTDKAEDSYVYDLKIKDDQNKLQNSASGVFEILSRVTIRNA